MDLINLSTEWAKAEVFSTRFFILFAILFFTASIGLWLFGKTDLAKAYVIPNLIAGLLTMTIGIGLFYTNKIESNHLKLILIIILLFFLLMNQTEFNVHLKSIKMYL